MSLASYVRILGRGPGRSRNLTEDEAEAAMRLMLSGKAAPEAVGALLMLMRYRGENADEVAGFVKAFHATLPPWPGLPPALDWPSYAAGRSRGAPWFLLAARLVAQAGVPVLLHGWNSHQSPRADIRAALPFAGVFCARSLEEAAELLDGEGIVYLPLEAFAPEFLRLLRLRDTLGLRSPMNTVARALNPGRAPASVQGVFHPPYRALAAETALRLGLSQLTVLKGGGGEFERHPSKPLEVDGVRGGRIWSGRLSPLSEATRRLAEDSYGLEALADLWTGRLEDPFAEAVVVGTAALALETLGVSSPEHSNSDALWRRRLDPAITEEAWLPAEPQVRQ